MSIKESAKSVVCAVRISPAMRDELKNLKIDIGRTIRAALHKEIEKVRKFYAIKNDKRSS